MKNALKSNPAAAWFIIAAISALAVTSVLSACQIQDIVKVKVPADVQSAIGSEPKISVSDSEQAWSEWVAYVDRNSTRFSDAIDRGNENAGLIRSLTDTGIAIGQDAASTLPGGALISTGLALMGGLFMKKPGSAKKELKASEESYKAGLEQGQRLALSVSEGLEQLRAGQGTPSG
tara:strand:+ start:191 stop:718 length:528 start_codon:yes stop_codon:yes gene_type:complete